MPQTISSVEGLMRRLSRIDVPADHVVFYRGHSNRNKFTLKPSLNRNSGHKSNEQLLLNELLSSNPADFRDDHSMFEKLVRMQHHSLPTRLLDITTNPLMALYFACCSDLDASGEIIILKCRKDRIKFSDSDTVSCISNISRLTAAERDLININLLLEEFNESAPILRLLHFIKEEKPYFTNCINPADMGGIICVKPRMSNQRILSQSGAFLLFGLNAILPEEGSADFTIERATINRNKKEKIQRELAQLNIHRGTVYPNIENSASVITAFYRSD